MSSNILPNVWRFVVLMLFQILVLQGIQFESGFWKYLHPIIYPLFIILLPIKTPVPLVLFVSFCMGLLIDNFYNSFGLHASASVFTAYARSFVLNIIEPRGGYNVAHIPSAKRYSMNWYMKYSAIMLLGHLLFYFSMEAFAPSYIINILLNTFFSFIVSYLLIMFYQIIFDPQD